MATPQDQEVLEFLKRHEVRTMAKDIARLREEEAKKERGRIEAIATEKPKPQPAQAQEQKAEPIEETIAPSGFERWKLTIPKPPSAFNKLLIRVLILAVLAFALLNLVLLWVWRTRKQVQPLPPPISPVAQQQLPAAPKPVQPVQETERESLPAFLRTESEQTIELSESSSFLPLLGETFQEQRPPGSLTSLAFLKKPEGQLLSKQEFLKGAGVQIPPNIQATFSEKNLLPFVSAFSKGSGQRFGFVIELDQTGGLEQTVGMVKEMRQWEPEMEKSFAGLLSLQGFKDRAYTKSFKTVGHKGVPIRFQTWSSQDLGICYAIVERYLIFSSSLESIQKAIDSLEAHGTQ